MNLELTTVVVVVLPSHWILFALYAAVLMPRLPHSVRSVAVSLAKSFVSPRLREAILTLGWSLLGKYGACPYDLPRLLVPQSVLIPLELPVVPSVSQALVPNGKVVCVTLAILGRALPKGTS